MNTAAPSSVELAVALRYLQALTQLAPHHAFARRLLREMAECHGTVLEYVAPIYDAPMRHLTPDEQLWRRTAEQLSAPAPQGEEGTV